MKTRASFALAVAGLTAPAAAQAPAITVWRMNLSRATGSSIDPVIHAVVKSLPADVQQVGYSATDVWVRASTVPSYSIGPFRDGNPNLPSNNDFVYRITRNPQPAATPAPTPLGPIGVCANGVPLFNPKDARSYFNLGIWNQNAIVVEGPGMDAALGHPAPQPQSGGIYHHHQLPVAVLEQAGETAGAEHSPLIGHAFDGYPIYGPFGHDLNNGSGGIVRIKSSYRLRSITMRTSLPGGTPLPPSQYGPPVSARYPLGYFVEDYEYVPGLGHLDAHNGRTCVTPEFPSGTYAYFATLDAQGAPSYPYLIGPLYRGTALNQRGLIFPPGLTAWSPQVQKTGAGCAGFTLAASGQPTIPNPSFALVSGKGPAGGTVLYLIGGSLVPIVPRVGPCPVFLDLGTVILILTGTLDGQGAHQLGLPIPADATLSGGAIHLQAAAVLGSVLVSSNAVTLLLE